MRVVWEKEEGLFGVDSMVWWGIAIVISIGLTIFLVYLNYDVAKMAWKGFLYLMRPSSLFPDLTSLPNYKDVQTTGITGMMSAAIYLNGIIVQKIVNALVVFMLFFVGLMYLYADLFEGFMGRLKSIIPRLIIALILAYASIYFVNIALVLGKYAYMVLYNQNIGALGVWKNPNFYRYISYHLQPPVFKGVMGIGTLAQWFMRYIWSFLAVSFSVMLLMVVVVRDVLFAVLIVLLPLASLFLLTPWTTKIGERIWGLAIDLILLPFVMIIPLMLVGTVANSVSFVIAGLVISTGAIYLLATEPFILSGIGFGRAGEHLSRSIVIGTGIGNVVGALGAERGLIYGGGGASGIALKGGLTHTVAHAVGAGHRVVMNAHRGTTGMYAAPLGTAAFATAEGIHHLANRLRAKRQS